MKTMLKAAVAAVAMVAGAQQAQAVRWVEYTIFGNGVVYTTNSTGFYAADRANFTAFFRVDVDPGSGSLSTGSYSTVGSFYNATYLFNSQEVRDRVVFGDESMTGTSSSPGLRTTNFSADFTAGSRLMTYEDFGRASAGVQSRISGTATAFSISVAEVANWQPSFMRVAILGPVPEPATWGMMLLGFGLTGASMRSRRRNTTVTYA